MGIAIHVETFKGRGRRPWRYRVVASNGQTIQSSQGYARRWNRDRAVKRLARLIPGIEARQL